MKAALAAQINKSDRNDGRGIAQMMLDDIIKKAESCESGVYIEVVTDRYAASALSRKLHESLDTLYV